MVAGAFLTRAKEVADSAGRAGGPGGNGGAGGGEGFLRGLEEWERGCECSPFSPPSFRWVGLEGEGGLCWGRG